MTEPYFTDGHVTLYCAGNEEILPTLADESVDIVVTSPPYNMGLVPGGNGRGTYKHTGQKATRFTEGYEEPGDDAMPQDDYDTWQRWVLGHLWRISRMGVFYNHRPRVEHGRLRDPLSGQWACGPLGDHHPRLRQRIILDRGTGIDVNKRLFCTRGEYLFLFAKPAFELVSLSASGMGDVWRIGAETRIPWHPAPFPLIVPARCIEATGATSVLDPFAGSGTTLRAAADAGITAIGIEKSATYCAGIVDRLSQQSLFGAVG